MKRVLIGIMILGLGLSTLVAQTRNDSKKELNEIKLELQKNMSDMPGSGKMIININKDMNATTDAPDAAFMGVYTEDLTFPKAQELGYRGYYGVLITGVVPASPAWDQRLQENDIIISMDGKEVTNVAVFERLRKQYRAGDTVSFELYRMNETINMNFAFGAREATDPEATGEEPVKQKKSVGYGGGTWIPMFFDTDMTDVNNIVTSMGFSKLNDGGVLMQGGGGKLPIGKGFFLGGQVTTFEDNKKILDPTVGSNYHIWMRYKNTMGGVTLDKRIALTKGIITSAGLMLGGGTHTIEVLKSNSNYQWDDATTAGVNEWNITFLNSNNTHSTASRHYIVVQPRAELMLMLLPWMGIRAEAGYTYGYAPKEGWRVKGMNKDNFEVLNSPNTEYQGLNVTIGPWFGF